MKKEKAISADMILLPLTFLFFGGIGALIFNINRILSVILLVLAAATIYSLLTSATHYLFDEKGVIICYFFGIKEDIPWSSVKAIKLSGSSHLVSRYGDPTYTVTYESDKKSPYFAKGEIIKTKRVALLMKTYYNCNIKDESRGKKNR